MKNKCIAVGRIPNKRDIEWRKFELLMGTLGKEPTPEKFEIFKNRGKK